MNPEQLQQLQKWLNEQIRLSQSTIAESKQSLNYGREAQYEGMKQAFEQCLGKLAQVRV